jgi:hypothetical protein
MSSTELSGALWRKSSYSNGQANCVEVGTMKDGRTLMAVRDSKAPDGPALSFSAQAWQLFTCALRADAEDRISLTWQTGSAARSMSDDLPRC